MAQLKQWGLPYNEYGKVFEREIVHGSNTRPATDTYPNPRDRKSQSIIACSVILTPEPSTVDRMVACKLVEAERRVGM
jgi:hypothetical protein